MREVLFVPKADDLALATSHLAQSSSTARRPMFGLLSPIRPAEVLHQPSIGQTLSRPCCVGERWFTRLKSD